jgi:hypothetical protein
MIVSNEKNVEGVEKVKWYKSSYLWNVVSIVALIIVQLFFFNISMDGKMPSMLIGVLLGTILGSIIKKRNDIGIVAVLSVAIIGNYYLLFKNGIFFPNYILLFFGLAIMVIRDLIKKNENHSKQKIIFMLVLLVSFFSLNHIMYGDNFLKDQNFYREIKKEYNISGKIREDDLKEIDRLHLDNHYLINSLEGIEYFRSLTFLSVWDGSTIHDFTSIGQLHNLERLVVWYADLDRLKKIEEMDSIEYLEILYPKEGTIDNLDNFPNLKDVYIQGMDLEDLNGLTGPSSLEELHLGDAQINSFDGIKNFPNLKLLNLYKIASDDCMMVFELDNLKKISIQGGEITELDEFKRMAKDKGIELEMSDNSLEVNVNGKSYPLSIE